MMDNCVICKIIKNEEPSFIVYENSSSLSFLDRNPSAPGHTLVTLKKHGETLLHYSAEELKDLMAAVQKVISALEKALRPSGLSIGINHRELAGIRHLHIHLIPRFPGDGAKIIQGLVYNKPKEDLKSIAEKIKKNV